MDFEEIQKQFKDMSKESIYEMYAEMEGYECVPVDIDTFLEDEEYLGEFYGNGKLFPAWKKELAEIFPDPFFSPYNEVCLSGDTKVDLLDGRSLSMLEILSEYDGKSFWVLSYNRNNNSWEPRLASCPKLTRYNAPVYRVTLDNGESFKGTADHSLIGVGNRKIKISDLCVGQSLKSYNRTTDEAGYHSIFQHDTRTTVLIHQLVQRYKSGPKINKGYIHHTHHKNQNRADNRPENLLRCSAKQHRNIHGKLFARTLRENPTLLETHGASISTSLQTFFNSPAGEFRKSKMSEIAKKLHDDPKYHESTVQAWHAGRDKYLATEQGKKDSTQKFIDYYNSLSPTEYEYFSKKGFNTGRDLLWNSPEYADARERHRESLREHMKTSGQAQRMNDAVWKGPNVEKHKKRASEQLAARNKAPDFQKRTQIGKVLRFLNALLSVFGTVCMGNYTESAKTMSGRKISLAGIAKAFDCMSSEKEIDFNKLDKSWHNIIEQARNYNHKVVSVEYVGLEDVYNFQVTGTETYPLSCGIVSSNCTTGSIGTGKTIGCGVPTILYNIYKLLCIKNPHEYYSLIKTDNICAALFTPSLSTGEDVLWGQIKTMLASSPYFSRKIEQAKKEGSRELLPNNIGFVVGSNPGHGLGRAIFVAIMDEANFNSKASEKAKKQYNTLKQRMTSRFKEAGGTVPGHMIMLSSRNTDADFLERHIEAMRNVPTTRVIEFKIWEVKPHEYSSETFSLFCGNDISDPFIIETDDQFASITDSEDIIQVPIDIKEAFELDIYTALKDLAGMAITTGKSLIRKPIQIETVATMPLIQKKEIIILPQDENGAYIQDFIDISALKKRISENGGLRYIHFDMSVNGDLTGIASAVVSGQKAIKRVEWQTGVTSLISDNLLEIDFALAIKAAVGQEIPFFKLREFMIYLRKIGMRIALISTDGFQSVDMRQLLTRQGFETGYTSTDRTNDAFLSLKNMIVEERIKIPNLPLLKTELKELQKVDRKYDHPQNGCFVYNTRIQCRLVDRDFKIRHIEIGLLVDQIRRETIEALSYNLETNEYEYKLITAAWLTKRVDTITSVFLDNSGSFSATPEHLILDNHNKYMATRDIDKDCNLGRTDDESIHATYVATSTVNNVAVYDIEVQDNHNFVLACGVIAHNSKDLADAVAAAAYNCYVDKKQPAVNQNDFMEYIKAENAKKANLSRLFGKNI